MKWVDMVIRDSRFRFSLLMLLVALHSFLVGAALMFLPVDIFHRLFDYQPITERFFTVQAGVFHVVLGIGYCLAAVKLERFPGLIILSITAKFIATIFLLTYSIFSAFIPVAFLSGIGDGLMGMAMLWAFLSYKRQGVIRENVQ
jgi:hypothetical protein